MTPKFKKESIPYFQRGAGLLDTRSKQEFVQSHIPGSVHLEADQQLSNRIGFVFPPDVPVILLLSDPANYDDVVYSLARVGYDNVVGYLAEGLDVWEKMGLPITSGDIKDIEPLELNDLMINGNGSRPVVVDVREPWEYQQGHVPGALLMPLGKLSGLLEELDLEKPVAVLSVLLAIAVSLPRRCSDRRASKRSTMYSVARRNGHAVDWNLKEDSNIKLPLVKNEALLSAFFCSNLGIG